MKSKNWCKQGRQKWNCPIYGDNCSFSGSIHVRWRICLMERLTLLSWKAAFGRWTIHISLWLDSSWWRIHITIAVARSCLLTSCQRYVLSANLTANLLTLNFSMTEFLLGGLKPLAIELIFW